MGQAVDSTLRNYGPLAALVSQEADQPSDTHPRDDTRLYYPKFPELYQSPIIMTALKYQPEH